MQTKLDEFKQVPSHRQLEPIYDRFDQAWQAWLNSRVGDVPEIADYVPPDWSDASLRGELLAELVTIDLEYRWRQGQSDADRSREAGAATTASRLGSLPRRPVLDDYVARYVDLGTTDQLPTHLILAEFQTRQRWGDHPDPREYAARFPKSAAVLTESLRAVETEVEAASATTPKPMDRPPAVPDAAAHAVSADRTLDEGPVAAAIPNFGTGELTGRWQPGQMIGKYEIIDHLGHGGMGTVYLARDTELDRRVALKVPFSEHRHLDAVLVERFCREARAAATIEHPNICTIHGIERIGDATVLVMAHVEGRTLDAVLKDRSEPLPVEQVVTIVRQLALALAEAHEHAPQVVHRDLKPANIMLDKRGEPVILDFGLAKREGDVLLTRPHQILGTLPYMSPEHINGAADVGPAGDIFSLGVIMYELLAGRRPFQGQNREQLIKSVLLDTPPAPHTVRTEVPAELSAICLKALGKKPAARYARAREFAEELSRYERGEVATVAPVQRTLPRTKLLLAATLLLGLGLAVWAAFFGFNDTERELPTPRVGLTTGEPPNEDSPGTKPVPQTLDQGSDGTTPGDSSGVNVIANLRIDFQPSAWKVGFKTLPLESKDLPLRDDDKLQFLVEFDPVRRSTLGGSLYLYLFWFDANGVCEMHWPKRASDPASVNADEFWEPPLEKRGKEQGWHRLGGDAGYEFVLAAASQRPLSPKELEAFQAIRLKYVRADQPDFDAAQSDQSTLVLPPESDQKLVVLTPDAHEEAQELKRGSVGIVKSIKEVVDFEERLRSTFVDYSGRVFVHQKTKREE